MKQIPTMIDGQTSLAADDFNQIPLETQTIIEASGQTLDGNFTNQASRAIVDLGMNAGFYNDTGTVNSIVLSNVNNPVPTSLRDGIEVTFKAANTNTGATTLNLSSLGSKSVKTISGDDPVAGFIQNDKYYKALYVASTDNFIIYVALDEAVFGSTVVGSNTIHWYRFPGNFMKQWGIFGNAAPSAPDVPAADTIDLAFAYSDLLYESSATVSGTSYARSGQPMVSITNLTTSSLSAQLFYSASSSSIIFSTFGKLA